MGKEIKRVLVFSNQKSHVTYEDDLLMCFEEPIHPYLGKKWSILLSMNKFCVEYLNTNNYKSSSKVKSFYFNFIFLPKKYDIVIIHSTSGLGRAFLVKLFNNKIKIVYFSLSQINPHGSYFIKYFRLISVFFDYVSSSKIYFGLNSILHNTSLKNFKQKTIYFPFYVDIDFFQTKLNLIKPLNKLLNNSYILVVGDITRDDEYLYNELKSSRKPIVRVSRDKKVIENVLKYYNPDRGDLILTGISFTELAQYYKNSLCCVIASREDFWQPGGITSIVEALACNAICIANSGGQIEMEFNHIAYVNNLSNPLKFFDYPIQNALKNKLDELEKLSNSDYQKLKSDSYFFVSKSLNLNKDGIHIINSILK